MRKEKEKKIKKGIDASGRLVYAMDVAKKEQHIGGKANDVARTHESLPG